MSLQQLRRQIADFTLYDTCLSLTETLRGPRDAKINDFDIPIPSQNDIVRAHIAVDQSQWLTLLISCGMSRVERFCRFAHNVGRQCSWKWLVPQFEQLTQLPKIHTIEKLHCDIETVIGFTKLKDLSDVRMRPLSRKLRLIDEHLPKVVIRRVPAQWTLQRHVFYNAVGRLRTGSPNLGHAA